MNEQRSGYSNSLSLFPSFFLCFCVDIQQDAQLFLCLQWTSVSSKEPLPLWTAMPHTTPESSSGTPPSPSLHTFCLVVVCMYKVWNASLLQLSVGSGWQPRPHDQRRPRLCASGFPDYWSDVVWGYWRLHLYCDISSWQRFSHRTPRSYVSINCFLSIISIFKNI